MVAAFNTVRIREGNKEKTAFITRYSLFKYLIIPFKLCNAPGTFQNFINKVIRPFLDNFIITYLDNILIYNKNL